VAHIKPEHLLEPRDYRQWMKVQTSDDAEEQSNVNDVLFESLSKRAWMDVLLQLVKVSIAVYSSLYNYLFMCLIYPVIVNSF